MIPCVSSTPVAGFKYAVSYVPPKKERLSVPADEAYPAITKRPVHAGCPSSPIRFARLNVIAFVVPYPEGLPSYVTTDSVNVITIPSPVVACVIEDSFVLPFTEVSIAIVYDVPAFSPVIA